MATKHAVKFYPVGHGDTTQIILHNGRRILFDFNHSSASEDPQRPEINLKAELTAELTAAGRDYFDIVAFTHADLDHIQGSTEFFELLHAKKYQGDDRIKIQELWMPAAMLLEQADNDSQSDEFVILRQEGRHRLLEGNGIRVFSKPPALMDWLTPKLDEKGESATARDNLFIDAGTIVDGFSLADDKVEFFCHSPFIKHCDDGDIIRNEASLVFNVRFDADGEIFDYLEIGDATWESLSDIVDTTKYHGNMDRLEWDIYNIPHHCSYLALSDEKGEKKTVPKPQVQEILDSGRKGAYIVSCSDPCTDIKESYDQKQPPHIQARKTYEASLDAVGGRKFLVTMEEPNANKPEPIVFELTSSGNAWVKSSAVGAVSAAVSSPSRAGPP
jgi:hypothetical protein